jgi:hypothetical protein
LGNELAGNQYHSHGEEDHRSFDEHG